jgi:hypothetical protein
MNTVAPMPPDGAVKSPIPMMLLAASALLGGCATTPPPPPPAPPPVEPGRYEVVGNHGADAVIQWRALPPPLVPDVSLGSNPQQDERKLIAQSYVRIGIGYYPDNDQKAPVWALREALRVGADKLVIYAAPSATGSPPVAGTPPPTTGSPPVARAALPPTGSPPVAGAALPTTGSPPVAGTPPPTVGSPPATGAAKPAEQTPAEPAQAGPAVAQEAADETGKGPFVAEFYVRYQLPFGAQFRNLTAAEKRRTHSRGGVQIGTVAKDTPAAKAGFRRGDLVLMFNGASFADHEAFQSLLFEHMGEEVKLSGTSRGGKRFEYTLRLGMPATVAAEPKPN